jgi:hypothetical protein
MNKRDELIGILEHSRAQMLALLTEIDKNRKIYPLWTIREMLAHLTGWDDAVIAFIQSLMAGDIPATPASRGVDYYNAETVATREGLDYDHIYREFIETRKEVLSLLQAVPEDKITAHYILPWGDPGTLVDIINIFGPHEEEHAKDIEKLITQSRKPR